MDPTSPNKDETSNQHKGRRKRNDQQNRDFTCGCGKSYLSYAALYTHLKQKHDSKPPNGTQLPSNANQKNGRGRPKRPEDNDKRSQKSDESSDCENEPEETIEEMIGFLDSLGNFRAQESMDDQQIQQFLLSKFPKEGFTDSSDYETILNYLKEFTDEKINNPNSDLLLNECVDSEKSLRKTNINKILAYYLFSVGPKLTEEAYCEMAIFAVFLAKALNQDGYQAKEKYINEQEIDQNIKEENNPSKQLYCNCETGEHMLLMANEFILNLLPEYFQKYTFKNIDFKIFGNSDEKLKNAVYVTQHLSYWLYSLKFTSFRLVLLTDEE